MDVNVNMDASDPRDQIIAKMRGQLNNLNMRISVAEANRHQPPAPPRVETISTRLPEFNGKNDPEIWISKIKTALHSCSYPEERWALAAAECMKDKAESWWFQLIREEGTSDMPWDHFKGKLLNQYNYKYQQQDVRQKLNELQYPTPDQYIDTFKRLIIKLHRYKITPFEISYLFTQNLPGLLKQRLSRARKLWRLH
ncbi:hypothetical protein PtB15_10B318 [Puccinia triticina]|nr:hypothetical protein PtB15_10B318 [Puccinia triticina]